MGLGEVAWTNCPSFLDSLIEQKIPRSFHMEMEVVHVVDTCSLSSRASQTFLDFSLHSITFPSAPRCI